MLTLKMMAGVLRRPSPKKDAGSITALELMLALGDLGYAELKRAPESTKRVELTLISKVDVTIVDSHFEADLPADAVPGTPVVIFPRVLGAARTGPRVPRPV